MSGAVPVIGAAGQVGQAALTVAQSQQQAGAARINAGQQRVAGRQADLAASGEELRAQSAALDIREQLLRTLSAQTARFAAAGLAPGSGTAQILASEAERTGARQVGLVETQGRINATSRRLGGTAARINAGLLDDAADFTRTAGALSAVAGLARGSANLFDATMPGTVTGPNSRGGATAPGMQFP